MEGDSLNCVTPECHNFINIHKVKRYGRPILYCNNNCYQRNFKRKSNIKSTKHFGDTIRCKNCNTKFLLRHSAQEHCNKQCARDYEYKLRRGKNYKENKKKTTQEFYLAENEYFYKFGRTGNDLQRFQTHSRIKLNILYTFTDKFYNIVEYERLIKNYVKEHNLKYEPLFIFDGHTETICKSKLDNPHAKWIVELLKDKVGQ